MSNPPLTRLAPWLLLPLYVTAALLAHHFTVPIPQDPTYHQFADTRAFLGIVNFADVASNLAILLPALAGCWMVSRRDAWRQFSTVAERSFAFVFFLAIAAAACGSTWYHLAPDDHRLLFDRLPIGLAFTALIAWLITERTAPGKLAVVSLLPWIALGPACVLWWYQGQIARYGDLRPYLLLYAFVFVLTPLLLLTHSPYDRQQGYWWAYLAFCLGMAGDRLDHPIHQALGGAVSGHTLKHVFMGVAMLFLLRMLSRRRPRLRL